MDKIIGYGVYPYGLSNQKLALLGLFGKAVEQPCAISVPRLSNYSTSKGSISDIEVRDVFDIDLLRRFAEEAGVTIHENPETVSVVGHDMFAYGNRVNNAGMWDTQSLSTKFWRALRPETQLARRIEDVSDKIFGELGVQAVVQLRIEPDWQRYVATVLHSRNTDDVPTTYQGILQRVSNTLGPSGQRILLTCDETQIPVDEIVQYARTELGICVTFKGAFLGGDVDSKQFFARSVIDFELGLRAPIFVGTIRSTFANTLFSTKIAMQPEGGWNHYIYKTAEQRLLLRKTSQAADQKNGDVLIREPYIFLDQRSTGTGLLLLAHIGTLGDRIASLGYIRPLNNKHNVQGFSISVGNGTKCDIWYRARLANGVWTDWVSNNKFVGTRGKYENLTGFSVRLSSGDRSEYQLEAIGKFTGDSDFVKVSDGQDCVPVTGAGFLCGMQILLRQI